MKLTQIYIYPIKSLRGIALEKAAVHSTGLQYDRKWMLVDQDGLFLSQRSTPSMTLLQPQITKTSLEVSHTRHQQQRITIPLTYDQDLPRMQVTIWDDQVEALVMPDPINNWFSSVLDKTCKLVYMDEKAIRPIKSQHQVNQESVSFADGYPILIIGEASLQDLNSRLKVPVEIIRFRPNLVFSGGMPFSEDDWKSFKVGPVMFRGIGACARCSVPTIDPETGRKSREPILTLGKYRIQDKKILFGLNALGTQLDSQNLSFIELGDEIELIH